MFSRRQFLLATGALATGLPAATSQAKDKYPIGIQLYTVREWMNQDPVGTLKQLAAIGYTLLESYQGDKGIYFGLKPAEFTKIAHDLGMTLFASHFNLGKTAENSITEAAAVGLNYMIVPYNELTSLETTKRAVDEYTRLGELCQKHGIQFGYHNHGYDFETFEGVVPYDLFLKQIDPKLMIMEMELYWFARMEVDPLSYIQKYPGRFPIWHVKDMDKQDRTANTEVGRGNIDYNRLFDHAKQAGLQYSIVEQDGHFHPSVWSSLTTSFKATKILGR
ncbi:sugar phosphate isomerase/epimerase family protein [Spirosoma agri]|uniref:Sugar phosphate isomerase/epimerase n=1 Tax=Spirosoma agri TaxID=1987381 RepID=A0A6M0IT19_9BACT|nr:sugar phosphate isomerase/epimerase [Spirosoma agri]NEU70741.1 sugar phosphate isomerase/epimerase [Spirosoma agri]